MQVTNNQFSPNFQGIRVQLSQMNQLQKNAANRIADSLDYMDEYQKASDMGVDVIFHTIDKSADKVKVSFLDADSEMFYKHKSTNKPVYNTFKISENKLNVIDKICRTLKKIVRNKFRVEDIDYEKVIKGETDMAKLDPTINEEFLKSSKNLDDMDDLYDSVEFDISCGKEIAAQNRQIGIHRNDAF